MIATLLVMALTLHNAGCTGDADCKACKTCTSCKHCKKEGGTCGACKPTVDKPAEDNTCVRVIDGDTVVVMLKGEKTTIRLIGVDTPELRDPRPEVKDMAKQASANTAKMVLGKKVVIEQEGVNKRDKYGRTLAYITVNGNLINEDIIRQGFGKAYVRFPFDPVKMRSFRIAEREARQNNRGLWQVMPGIKEPPPRIPAWNPHEEEELLIKG